MLVDLVAHCLECVVLNWCWNIMQEVPPLHLTEILAYLVRQSGPFLDQLGIRRGMNIIVCLDSPVFVLVADHLILTNVMVQTFVTN